jgi:aspartyl-tRNA(Asn)/glutamyl-tRNA(Gln) amidotransferase subunit C
MPGIDKKAVKHVAHLARLELDEKDLTSFSAQLALIIEYISKLNEIDTSGAAPTSHPLETLKNVFRKDIPKASLSADEAAANAPQRDGDLFRVPPVIEGK